MPANPLKVLQVSDSHVSADPDAVYRTLNADRSLRSLLSAMRAWGPDLVLLTGDVTEDARPEAYSRVAAMLRELGAPVLALPGNHDDPQVMLSHFPQGPWNGPLKFETGSWLLVLMDSTVRGRVSGSVEQQDLDRMGKLLEASAAEFILVALHHQPVPVNAPWIDRFALENPDGFFQCLDRDPRVRCVTWGHVHHAFHARRNGVDLFGAPSAAANSLPETPKFTLDPAGPACRWLELYQDGRVETGFLRPL